MKNLLKFCFGICAAALLAVGCDPKEDEASDVLKLIPDKGSIAPDGTDAVTFKVTLNGLDVTSTSKIFNQTDQVYLEGAKFSTAEEGDYVFVAERQGLKSDPVTINVLALQLFAENTDIEANGTDAVVFTVEAMGEDVTADATVLNKTDDTPLTLSEEGVYTFSTTTVGTYEFVAIYNGNESPVISVYVGNVFDVSKPFYRNVLLIKGTGDWCGYCPSMATAIEQAEEALGGHIAELAVHNGDKMSIPAGNTILNYFGIAGTAPNTVVDLDKGRIMGGAVPSSTVINFVNQAMEKYPTVTLLKVRSFVENGKATVTVKLGVKETGQYRVGLALIEDGIIGRQSGGGSQYSHNRTLRAMATGVMGDDMGTIEAGKTAEKTFTLDITDKYVVENLKVVAYAVAPSGGKQFANNAVDCPINGVGDYRYDE